jgi:hypothetical protein
MYSVLRWPTVYITMDHSFFSEIHSSLLLWTPFLQSSFQTPVSSFSVFFIDSLSFHWQLNTDIFKCQIYSLFSLNSLHYTFKHLPGGFYLANLVIHVISKLSLALDLDIQLHIWFLPLDVSVLSKPKTQNHSFLPIFNDFIYQQKYQKNSFLLAPHLSYQ